MLPFKACKFKLVAAVNCDFELIVTLYDTVQLPFEVLDTLYVPLETRSREGIDSTSKIISSPKFTSSNPFYKLLKFKSRLMIIFQ